MSRPLCLSCRGTGKVLGNTCPECEGRGTPYRMPDAPPPLVYTHEPRGARKAPAMPRKGIRAILLLPVFIAGMALGVTGSRVMKVNAASPPPRTLPCQAPERTPLQQVTPTPATFPLIQTKKEHL